MDVFQLWGKIAIDNAQANSAIDDTTKKASTFGDVLKANLASDVIISGIKKLASVVTEVGKAAYESYAEYEQLAGGAELMFGSAYNTVAQNAKNAYKTVQMSQNEYLQQVNGFATGLKTALGGNEQAAADLAHKIIVAEADVVAATGNSQEAIQNAFNGIMKSNYMMLDNLQLGITPTKQGFQEVIDKVNEWNEAQGNATNYTIDNLADCQSALVDYIEMQGLAGYAANEAADTIQGSTASMKAAWSNLATGMADETADMDQLTQDFVKSVGTAANNIIPRVQQIVSGVGTATSKTISYLRDTNETIDLVVSVVEDLGIVAATTGAVLAANLAGKTVANIATVFIANAQALAYFTKESGKAAVAEATLTSTFSIGEVAVGVLTGKISLATAAQYAWNTAMNANPIGVVIGLASALAIAVKKARKSVNELADSYVIQAESSAECAENLAELKARYDELTDGESNPNKWAAKDRAEITALGQAIEETEQQLVQLEQAEAEAAEAMTDFATETESSVDAIIAAAETYADSVQSIMEDYYNTYDSIYNGLHDIGTAFIQVTEKTEITWQQAMENMSANTKLLEDMDSNFEYVSGAASDAGVNIDGFSGMLASMSTADAAGLLAALRTELEGTGEDSQKAATTLSELSTAISNYATAGQDYSQSLAQIVEDVNNRIADATSQYAESVASLDQGAEALTAGTNTMEGLLTGINSGIPNVLSTVGSMASQMKSTLSTSFSGYVLKIKAVVSGSASIPGHADGLDWVPYDNYLAYLHKGEAVLTASEARTWRSGGSSSGNVDYGYRLAQIDQIVETLQDLLHATEAGQTIVLNDREFGRAVRGYA